MRLRGFSCFNVFVVGGCCLLRCVLLGGVGIVALVVGGLVPLFLWLAAFGCVVCCCLGLLRNGFIVRVVCSL